MPEEVIAIAQWNCRSIKKNYDRKDELKNLLNDKTPHICCVSETWFDENTVTPQFKGYTKIYRKDRQNGEGGGLITLQGLP